MKKKIAICVGDLNGIGIELILRNHNHISKFVEPIYCIDIEMLQQASDLLGIKIPQDFCTVDIFCESFTIYPSLVSAQSGAYSYHSFLKAIELAKAKSVAAIVTLPIHKKAWELAGVQYKGHTDALRDILQQDAIMMLGSPAMYVALYTEHIPLREVAESLQVDKLRDFLVNFYVSIEKSLITDALEDQKIALLGLNPHAGDDGVLGCEELIINEAREASHRILNKEVYSEPLVPDVAFTPNMRNQYRYFVAMYHDQGLIPLKALYFDESINVSLNLSIQRTSVDHGTAFDKAYKRADISSKSYLNAVHYLL